MESPSEFNSALVELIPHLRAFSRSLCVNPSVADDIAQDALAKAIVNREKYNKGTNMKAWLFTILRNEFYDLKRRSWRSVSLDQEAAEQTIQSSDKLEDTFHMDQVRRAMYSLSDDHREALVLVGASGMTYDEAATICGVAAGTIKSRVNRARVALEEILANGQFNSAEDGIDSINAADEIIKDAEALALRTNDE